MVHPYQPKDKTPLYDKGAGGTSPPHKDFKKNDAPKEGVPKGIPSSVLKQRWHSAPSEFSLHNQQRVQRRISPISPPAQPTPPKQPPNIKQVQEKQNSFIPKQPIQKHEHTRPNQSYTQRPTPPKQSWGKKNPVLQKPKQEIKSVPTQKTVIQQQQNQKSFSSTPSPSQPTPPKQKETKPTHRTSLMAKLFSSKKKPFAVPSQKESVAHQPQKSLRQNIQKKPPQEQQKRAVSSLRTLQADVRSVIDTKGDLQLKKIAIQEMEKKKRERETLRKQSKVLFKKSLQIREKTNAFKRQQDLGALSSVQALNKKKEATLQPTRGPKEEKMFHNLVSQALDTMEYDAQQAKKDSSNTPSKKTTPVQKLSASLPRQSQDTKTQRPEQQSPEETKIQRDSVEKENLRKAWHDFQIEKARFDEKGLRVQNVRELHGDDKPIRRRGSLYTLTVLFVILLTVAGIVIITTSLLSRSKDVVIPPEKVYSIADIFSSKKVQEVNLTDGVQEWHNLLKKQHKLGILTSFVPYTEADDGTQRILPIQDLFSTFQLRAPTQLVQSLGDYYRIAQYRTDTNTTAYVMLFLVDNYPAALVGMLAWERLLVNDAAKLFGDAVKKRQTPTSNSLSDLRIIDNKDVRILKNSSTSPVSYYFFNDKALVILTGNTDLIPFINTRIRQQAALATN